MHKLIPVLAELAGSKLDDGSEFFEPSSLQITSVDVGNKATNVIPGEAVAKLNIRFNDLHSGASLTAWLKDVLAPPCAGCHAFGENLRQILPDAAGR